MPEIPEVEEVLFTGPSTVESAVENGLVPQILARGTVVGGIGPVTARALAKAGLEQRIAPTGYGPDNLARATVYRFVFGAGAARNPEA